MPMVAMSVTPLSVRGIQGPISSRFFSITITPSTQDLLGLAPNAMHNRPAVKILLSEVAPKRLDITLQSMEAVP